ncbi:MAG: hypothetical protein GFH27_549309n63 [Chloroflexi bacterium AL-W]|nr:hypothetical protein [Chloroflexi bacterium AL-W]
MHGTTFGQWLRHQRDQRGLTREALAQQIGYSAALLRKLETGERRPSHQVAERLAQIFEVAIDQHSTFIQHARNGTAPLLTPTPTATPAVRALGPITPVVSPSNLPAPRTTLIGRNTDVQQVCQLLTQSEVRLVTLTGHGGVGKTRLALQVAAQIQNIFLHGVWFIDLTTVTDPTMVISTIAQTLGIREHGSTNVLEQVQIYLQTRNVLLFLDNFEQVLDAASQVAQLLDGVAQLKILITSRVRLQLDGEHVVTVEPLVLPPLDPLPPLVELAKNSSVALFVARAQASQKDFALTETNATAIATVCMHLAGLPLALELAAARLRVLSPTALLQRLIEHHEALTEGVRDGPSRQQSMQATIGWSYGLLKPAEQILFIRLAVFVGGCTLTAIETICSGQDTDKHSPTDTSKIASLWIPVLDGLAALLDSNLITRSIEADDEPRFGMLVPIYSYARNKLLATPEIAILQERHAGYYLAFAEQAAAELTGPQQQQWLDWLEHEHDNLRAALQWFIEQEDAESALRLGTALWRFWEVRGHWSEGVHWLEQALSREQQIPIELRASTLHVLGRLLAYLSEFQRAYTYLETSLQLWRDLGDQGNIALLLNSLGLAVNKQGQLDQATVYFEESYKLYQLAGDTLGAARAQSNLGVIAAEIGDCTRARSLYQDSLANYRKLGDTAGVSVMLGNLGIVMWLEGDYEEARRLTLESLKLARQLNYMPVLVNNLVYLVKICLSQHDLTNAQVYLLESLPLTRDPARRRLLADTIEGAAGLAGKCGQYEQAARLWGATSTLRETISSFWPPSERPFYEQLIAEAASQIDPSTWEAAWLAGQQLSWEQAFVEAFEIATMALPTDTATTQPDVDGASA